MPQSQLFTKKTMPELNRKTAEALKTVKRHDVWVILDSVRSRNNVGAIFRTADALLLGGVYLCGFTPTPPHRDIYKTALGATETVPWSYHKNIEELLKEIKQSPEHHIWGVEQTHDSTALQDFEKNSRIEGKWFFILGNEVSGVSDKALSYCEGCLEIPQWGNKHSFNVAVSAGLVLWEVIRTLYLTKSK